MNVPASTYDPGPPPRSVSLTFGTDGDWVTEFLEIVDADGRHIELRVRARYDGQEYPLIGTAAATIALAREDAYTTESTVRENGDTVAVYRRSVSRDGRILTVRQTGKTASGARFRNTVIYDRQ